jgi:NAD(P)-dependent dehydrogenase (short-subunit alcohol dehydrogenase family)
VGAATGARPADVASQSVTGRFTQPAEVAGLVLFLAGDGAGNITRADFTIDGGWFRPGSQGRARQGCGRQGQTSSARRSGLR